MSTYDDGLGARGDSLSPSSIDNEPRIAKMRVSLSGMFAHISGALRKGDRSMAEYYVFSLEELKTHLEETVRGEHTLAEFADYYCLIRSGEERKR